MFLIPQIIAIRTRPKIIVIINHTKLSTCALLIFINRIIVIIVYKYYDIKYKKNKILDIRALSNVIASIPI